MVDQEDAFDLAALFRTSPAAAMAAIGDRLEILDAERRASFHEEVVTLLEEVLGRGTPDGGDWFELILEGPLLNQASVSGDPPPQDTRALEARLCCLLIAALANITPESRGFRVSNALRDLPDISLLCAAIQALEQLPDGPGLGESLPEIRKALLDRIGALAETSAFWAQRFPASLLWFWFLHGEEQRVYLFTRRAMEDTDGLAALLTILVERIGTGDEEQDIVAVRRWSRIIDFQALEVRAVKMAMSAPSRTDRRRARRYLDAFAAGKAELFR